MNKTSEQSNLSAPSKRRTQESGGNNTSQPYYKATTIFPQTDAEKSRAAVRQEHQPSVNNDEKKAQQEHNKS